MSSLDDEITSFINDSSCQNEETFIKLNEDFEIPIYKSKNDESYIDTIVMSGGGIKGVAHLGVLKALELKGILDNITTFAGTSVGSLIISLFVVGYSPKDLFDIVKSFDLEKMKNLSFSNILTMYGLDNGKKIEYVIKKLICAKQLSEDITLSELYKITSKSLIITTTCLNSKETVYLSHKTHPHLELHKAIRMSISIPIIFTPVEYNGEYYIDGACIDNYPIHTFKDRIDRVIGVYLGESTEYVDKIDNFESYLLNMINCLMKGVTYNCIAGYEHKTIELNLDDIGMNMVKFGISIDIKQKMFNIGFNQAMEYLKKNKKR